MLEESIACDCLVESAHGKCPAPNSCTTSYVVTIVKIVSGAGELIARVRTALRRTGAATTIPTQPSFACGDLKISFAQRQVTVAGNEVKLTPTKYSLLQELVLNAGKLLTHTYLLNKVWGPEYREDTQYLHVFVRHLRAKLETDPTNPRYIIAMPGVGYQFKGLV